MAEQCVYCSACCYHGSNQDNADESQYQAVFDNTWYLFFDSFFHGDAFLLCGVVSRSVPEFGLVLKRFWQEVGVPARVKFLGSCGELTAMRAARR